MKQRNGCVSAFLWFFLLANLAMAIYYAISIFGVGTRNLVFGVGATSVFAVLRVLGAILLMRWVKAGFYLIVITSIMEKFIDISVLEINVESSVFSLSAILIWWLILQIKKDGESAWSQMITGVDYKHCRHLYQVFGVVCIILVLLTLIAAGLKRNNPVIEDDEVYPVVEEVVEEPVDSIAVFDEPAPVQNVKQEPAKEDRTKDAPTTPARKDKTNESSGDNDSMSKSEMDVLLKSAISEANEELPSEIGSGLVMTRVYMTGRYVMYVIECDENEISMESLEEGKDAMLIILKETVKEATEPDVKQFYNIIGKTGRDLGFTYIGDTSGTKVTVYISATELKKYLPSTK